MAFERPQLKTALLLWPFNVQHRGEWYRLFSHAFIHADWIHLGLNMFVLYSFGTALEGVLPVLTSLPPVVVYLVLYIGGALFSALPAMAKHRNNANNSSLGASGAVAAVLFAMIVVDPFSKLRLFGLIPITAWLFGPLYLYYSYSMDKRGSIKVAHDAHFYGAAFGALFAIALHPDLLFRWFQ